MFHGRFWTVLQPRSVGGSHVLPVNPQRPCNCQLTISFSRCLSSSTSRTTQWKYDTRPFGKLIVRTVNQSNIDITRLNPNSYPLQNKVFVDLVGKVSRSAIVCEQHHDEIHIFTEHSDEGTQDSTIQVKVPMKFGEYLIRLRVIMGCLESSRNYCRGW